MSPLEYVVSSYLKTAKVDLELFAVGIKERRLQTLWSPVLGACQTMQMEYGRIYDINMREIHGNDKHN